MINNIKNETKVLILLLKTWTSDTLGIFDYSSLSPKEDKTIIKESQFVVRDKNNKYMSKKQHADINFRNGDDIIFLIDKVTNNTYMLVNIVRKKLKMTQYNFNNIDNKLWYVIKKEGCEDQSKSNEEYYLQKYDIIKLGRVKYIVKDICIINEGEGNPALPFGYNISNLNSNKGPIFNIVFELENDKDYIDINEKSTPSNNNKTKCYICNNYHKVLSNTNSETDDGENFLIKICNCDNKYYHYKCLKAYVQNSIESNTKDYDYSIEIKNFGCEKCSVQFPSHFKLPKVDKKYDLFDIQVPDCDYMILESLDYKKEANYYKSIHVIKLSKEIISIGRDNESDIVFKDISISRDHAVLKYEKEKGKVFIQNRSKKFGTSVLIKEPFKVLDKKIFLQVGRTYIECYLSREIEENINKDKSDLNKKNNENKKDENKKDENNGDKKEDNNNNIKNDEDKKEIDNYYDKPEELNY